MRQSSEQQSTGRTRRNGMRWFIKGLCVVLLLAIVWFVGVDKIWIVETCRDCARMQDVWRYRVFGLTIHETVQKEKTLVQRIAADLGMACPHRSPERWDRQCYGGLVYRTGQFASLGADFNVNNEWYDEGVIERVKARGIENPNSAEEFRQRVIFNHDMVYFRSYVRDLRGE